MVGDVFISVFPRFSVKNRHDTGEKKNTVFLFACIYILLSIKVGLVRFGYVDKGIN